MAEMVEIREGSLNCRAMRVLKQKKLYEGQRDMLYNQAFSLDQVSFASEGIKDAQHTIAAVTVGNKELTGTLKRLNYEFFRGKKTLKIEICMIILIVASRSKI